MKFFKKHKNNLLIFTVFIFLIFSITLLQKKYDDLTNPKLYGYYAGTTKYILPSFVVNNFSFGFKNILADYYWINVIQDLADWDRTNDFYIEEYKNLATLDPKFSYPYLFGILVISSKKYPEDLNKLEPISNIGIKNLPYNWEIPFYLGTEFHLLKEEDRALKYIEIAASRPIIPDIIHHIYNSYLKRTLTGTNASREFVKTIYETTESKTTKKIIKEGMILSELTQAIKSVVDEYKTKYGAYPESIDVLVKNNMIQISPALKEEFDVLIDKSNGNVEVLPKRR